MHFKISFNLILVFLFCSIQSFSQKTLSLKPVIGNQVLLSHYDRSTDKPDFLKIDWRNSNNSYRLVSLQIELKFNENWRLSSGYSRETLGWGFRISLPDSEKLSPAKYSLSSGGGRANRLHRIPVVVKKTFLNTCNYEPTSLNKLSWFDARLFIQGGFSFDFYTPEQRNLEQYPEHIIGGRHGDTIKVHEKITILNQQSISAITGVGTEIYFKGKPLFELTFFYNQGLRNLIASDVHYQVNSLSGHTRIITRGSSFGTSLAVPIRLATFKAKADS